MKLKEIQGNSEIFKLNQEIRQKAHEHLSGLAMPPWALGRLLELAEECSVIKGTLKPVFKQKMSIVMAGDHGVVSENVSAYPKAVTQLMVSTMLKGKAAINVLAKQADSEVLVVDIGVDGLDPSWQNSSMFLNKKIAHGSENMSQTAAMSREQAEQSIQVGIDVTYQEALKAELVGIGEMGIGNTTAATAILCALTGLDAQAVTGKGTGIDSEQVHKKASLIEEALRFHQPDANDAIDVLSKVGGYEIGGMTGLILGAAAQRKCVIIDGLISTSAALLAQRIAPEVTNFIIASHQSVEPGHIRMLETLGKRAYLDLNLRLGEGTGAALMMPMVDSACAIMTDMAQLKDVIGS